MKVKRTSRASIKKSNEPWLSKTQKIIATIISCLVLAGMIWGSISKADARYAKEQIVKKDIGELKTDVAMLGRAFQIDQYDRSISTKQEMTWKIEDRLRQRISPAERYRLEEIKRQLQAEIDALKDKQKKLN